MGSYIVFLLISFSFKTIVMVISVERAQQNLWRKLGVGNDEMAPIEQVLQDFLNMFQGALPDFIISAMTALFDLDDEAADQVNEALLQMAGDDVGELQQMDHAAT
ncbi:hypothetical protein SEVIR_2G085951v4 [Setaria viridis]